MAAVESAVVARSALLRSNARVAEQTACAAALPAWFRDSSSSMVWASCPGDDGLTACAICHEEFQQQSVCRRLMPCKHIFHDHCIIDWWSRRATCPLCRRSMAEKSRPSSGSARNGSFGDDRGRAVVVVLRSPAVAAISSARSLRGTATTTSATLTDAYGASQERPLLRDLAQVSEALRVEVGRVRRQLRRVSSLLAARENDGPRTASTRRGNALARITAAAAVNSPATAHAETRLRPRPRRLSFPQRVAMPLRGALAQRISSAPGALIDGAAVVVTDQASATEGAVVTEEETSIATDSAATAAAPAVASASHSRSAVSVHVASGASFANGTPRDRYPSEGIAASMRSSRDGVLAPGHEAGRERQRGLSASPPPLRRARQNQVFSPASATTVPRPGRALGSSATMAHGQINRGVGSTTARISAGPGGAINTTASDVAGYPRSPTRQVSA